MSALPTHFKADLRHPVEYKDIDDNRWFEWRTLPMIELSALDTYQFVKGMITRPAQKILEVGCGNGYLSLELARDGHDVTGIDLSQDIIEVAERADDAQSIESLRNAWLKRSSGHGLNRYEDMYVALQTAFHQQFFAWVPYLFVYIGNGIRNAAPEKEREVVAFIKSMEKHLIEKGYIQSVGFRYVGSI